jgi:hypothetical protein
MLNATGNYIYQLADPDINFDWDTIEQVVTYLIYKMMDIETLKKLLL